MLRQAQWSFARKHFLLAHPYQDCSGRVCTHHDAGRYLKLMVQNLCTHHEPRRKHRLQKTSNCCTGRCLPDLIRTNRSTFKLATMCRGGRSIDEKGTHFDVHCMRGVRSRWTASLHIIGSKTSRIRVPLPLSWLSGTPHTIPTALNCPSFYREAS